MPDESLSARAAERVAAVLERCIQASKDAQDGFALAAAHAREPELRVFFERAATQRGEFVAALRGFVEGLGLQDGIQGSVLGTLHRAAMDVRLAVHRGSDRVLLEECDRGEKEGQKTYEIARSELLRAGAPKRVRDAVDGQYAAVCNARYEIDRLLGAMPATSRPDGG